MRYNDLKLSILDQFKAPNGHKVVPFILGKPGGGKSSCAREIADELQKLHGIPNERVVEFNPSLREPTDILGLPKMDDECSRWLPAQEFYDIRAGQGPSILIIEELSDATMDMQNPLCRVILDRFAGQMKLSEELYIIATGNRTEDRSGASRLSTKLGNRMRLLNFDESLDDWISWATRVQLNPVLRGFIKFRPNLLSDFDAKRSINPTPRSWADVAMIPMEMKDDLYFEHVAGSVGEGAAVEFCGFLRVYKKLPSVDDMLNKPESIDVSGFTPDVLYAISTKIVTIATKDNFDTLYKLVRRFPAEFVVMVGKDISSTNREATRTKGFVTLATEYADVVVGV